MRMRDHGYLYLYFTCYLESPIRDGAVERVFGMPVRGRGPEDAKKKKPRPYQVSPCQHNHTRNASTPFFFFSLFFLFVFPIRSPTLRQYPLLPQTFTSTKQWGEVIQITRGPSLPDKALHLKTPKLHRRYVKHRRRLSLKFAKTTKIW